MQKGELACKGLSLPVNALEEFVVQNLIEKSRDYEYLTDKQKMLEMAEEKIKQTDTKEMIASLEKRKNELLKKRNVLLDKLEKQIIEDEVFKNDTVKSKKISPLWSRTFSLLESIGSQDLILIG